MRLFGVFEAVAVDALAAEMKGVCCSCQMVHPVVPHSPSEVEVDSLDGSECVYYVMAPHRMFGDAGVECEGAGTCPQALVRDNKLI